MISYVNSNKTFLILYNQQFSTLSKKILKLKQGMLNPFIAFKNWSEEVAFQTNKLII